ncbi:unnamed protein product [Lota lota]
MNRRRPFKGSICCDVLTASEDSAITFPGGLYGSSLKFGHGNNIYGFLKRRPIRLGTTATRHFIAATGLGSPTQHTTPRFNPGVSLQTTYRRYGRWNSLSASLRFPLSRWSVVPFGGATEAALIRPSPPSISVIKLSCREKGNC